MIIELKIICESCGEEFNASVEYTEDINVIKFMKERLLTRHSEHIDVHIDLQLPIPNKPPYM